MGKSQGWFSTDKEQEARTVVEVQLCHRQRHCLALALAEAEHNHRVVVALHDHFNNAEAVRCRAFLLLWLIRRYHNNMRTGQ